MKNASFITPTSGCHMARWVVVYPRIPIKGYNDCSDKYFTSNRLEKDSKINPYDTIYVPFMRLKHFVKDTLPKIRQPFVLISGQESFTLLGQGVQPVFDLVANNEYVVKWFIQQASMYGQDHPKVRLVIAALQNERMGLGSIRLILTSMYILLLFGTRWRPFHMD
jgi:hypothetical protein